MASIIKQFQDRVDLDQAQLDKEIKSIIKDLEKFLNKNTLALLKDIPDSELDPIFLLNNLINQFKSLGFEEQLGNIAEVYGNQLARVQSQLMAETLITPQEFIASIDMDSVEALIKYRVETISNNVTQVIGNVRPMILENLILGNTPDLLRLSAEISDGILNYANTELNTSLQAFSRTVTQVQAEKLNLTTFIYVGPYDGITRKFCQRVLTMKSPPIYTSTEIASMKNGQIEPVSIYAGGYNCRHRWLAVSKRKAQEFEKEWEESNYVDKKAKET